MSGRRWNALFWVAMLAVLGGSAASLVLWPVHKSSSGAKPRATNAVPTRSSPSHRSHAPAPTSQPASPAPAVAAPPRVKLVVFAARGASRVVVRRSTSYGPVLFNAMLARGGTLKLSGVQLYAQVSQIANVNVRVNTRMVDLTCTAANGVILTPTRTIPTQPPDCPKPPSDAS